jgi:hypothetical protein
MAGEETDGSEEAAGRDDAAGVGEGLDGEEDEDEEVHEVLIFAGQQESRSVCVWLPFQ